MLNTVRRLRYTRRYLKSFGWDASFEISRALTMTRSGKLLKIRLPGAPGPLWLRSGSTDITLFKDIFLYEQYRYDWDVKPKFIVDCWAHIGLASIYFARKYPDASILSVEASKENFELLERNTISYPQITRRWAAAWAEEGKVSIENPSADPWAFRCVSTDGGTIPAASIAQLSGGVPIDILKMDIEGAEKEIFSGGDLGWLKSVRVIMIELHDRQLAGCAESFYRRLPHGFRQVLAGETTSVLLNR